MPELVSATALLAMPPLMAYLAVRCLREVIPAWHVGGIFCFENPMDHYDPRFPEHSKFPIVAARMTHRKPDDCEERA